MKIKAKLMAGIVALIPLLSACQGIIEGEVTVKNPGSGQCADAASYTRIIVGPQETQCSGAEGLYSITVTVGNRTVTYRKSGYKTKEELVSIQQGQTVVKDVCLEADTPATSIRGTITWNRQYDPEGIVVKLYSCAGCTCDTEIDSYTTCLDGKFSFPDLAEGLSYKISASATGCQFSPAEYSISIPQTNSQPFNFSGTCQ
jgi:hypothetical protein